MTNDETSVETRSRPISKKLAFSVVAVVFLVLVVVLVLFLRPDGNEAITSGNGAFSYNLEPSVSPSEAATMSPTVLPVLVTATPHRLPTSTPTGTVPTRLPTSFPTESRVTRQGSYELLESVPHDVTAFTQGLVIAVRDETATLYEGTGLYGSSDLRQVDLPTGQILQQRPLGPSYFGEGVAYFETAAGEGRIIQLTWREQTGFLYEVPSLERLSTFAFSTTNNNEGWGITWRQQDDTFVVSDGSSFLHIWNATTLEEVRRVRVYQLFEGGERQSYRNNLNELEWDASTDTILSNVWFDNQIYRISVESGFVLARYDLTEIVPVMTTGGRVLNGIALVPGTTDEYWVTGKQWPRMFRVRLID